MKVIHVMRTYFSKESVMGGGERYPTELASAMANYVDTELLSFGNERRRVHLTPKLTLKIFPVKYFIEGNIGNPLSFFFLREIRNADVVHCHSYNSVIANLCIIYSTLFKKKIFVSDHGGNNRNLAWYFDIGKYVDKFLVPSNFAVERLMEEHKKKAEAIYGGVDTARFKSTCESREKKVLCVARYLPHKGQNYLIEATPPDVKLNLVGTKYDAAYYALLKKMSEGKDVTFIENLRDKDLIHEYSSSLVTALPSVYRKVSGNIGGAPELLGLTLLESMACGTPVICTNVGGMPEIVEDGKTGFIVPPNNVEKLREKILYFIDNPSESNRMGKRGRECVEKKFTWEVIAKKCLEIYRE